MDYARGEGPLGASPFLRGRVIVVPRYRKWLGMRLLFLDVGSDWICNCRPAIQAAVQDALSLKSEHSGT